MGAVFSIVTSPLHLAQTVLTLGVAASASAFQPFNPDYFGAFVNVVPFCETAEVELFEDFSDVLTDLYNESSSEDLNTCAPPFHRRSRFELHPRLQSLEQSTIWRSRTAEAKKLYMVAANQAKRKALRFHRRYTLYGPPDWTDPALSILPPACLLPGNFYPNTLPSVFPFASPHIVVSPPQRNFMDPIIAWSNSVQCQDEAFGNKLIVARSSSLNGPCPLIVNPAPHRPAPVEPIVEQPKVDQSSDDHGSDDGSQNVPLLVDDNDSDGSSCGSSECSSVAYTSDDRTALPTPPAKEASFRDVVHSLQTATFWIEEDEEDLPDLPGCW